LNNRPATPEVLKLIHVSDTHPCTSSDDAQALLAPLPAVIPGETYRSMATHGQATSDLGVDDEAWAMGTTGFGWGVPVMPGFASLEAKNADPFMGHVLNGGDDCPYVGAYLSAPTELTYEAAMDPSNPERDQWLIAM